MELRDAIGRNRVHPGANWSPRDGRVDSPPVSGEDLEARRGRLAPTTCEDEPSHGVFRPHRPLQRSVPNALIAGDHHKSPLADDRQPHVVVGPPGYVGELGMTRIAHIRKLGRQSFPEREVVLVHEERRHGWRLRGQTALLLLVRDRSLHLDKRDLVRVRNFVDDLARVVELPKTLGRHT